MRKRSGQTIMELLVAMLIISIGLFGAVGLVYGNLALVDRDLDEIQAVNLAREGVELAKETRDANWLAGNPFNAGFSNGTDYTMTPVWDGVVETPSFDASADDFSHPNTKVVRSTDANAPGFFANANVAAQIGGDATLFSRLLTFHPICDDYAALDSGVTCADTGKATIGVRVESHVRWFRKTQQKDFTIFSDVYDWR